MFEAILGDTRQAIRALRNAPAFTATAVLLLAFGIGALATVFSAVDAVLLRPGRSGNDQQLVWITSQSRTRPQPRGISYLEFTELSDERSILQSTAAYDAREANVAV